MDILNRMTEEIFGVSTGISEVVNDLQFANRFRGILTNPNGKPNLFEQKDSYFIKSFNVPNENITIDERNTDGIKIAVAKGREYDSINVVFYDREGGILRNKFLDWLDIIYSKETGRTGYYSDYATSIGIEVLSTMDINSNYETYAFIDAFPISVGDLNYGRDLKNTVQEFSVTFSFKKLAYVKTEDRDDQTGSTRTIDKIF